MISNTFFFPNYFFTVEKFLLPALEFAEGGVLVDVVNDDDDDVSSFFDSSLVVVEETEDDVLVVKEPPVNSLNCARKFIASLSMLFNASNKPASFNPSFFTGLGNVPVSVNPVLFVEVDVADIDVFNGFGELIFWSVSRSEKF